MKKSNMIPLLWLVSGIVLAFAGVLSIFSPSDMRFVSYTLGIAALLYGIFNCIMVKSNKNPKSGKRWILIDGLQTLAVAIILLCNQWIAITAVPVVLAMWVINAGITRLFLSFDFKSQHKQSWYWIGLLALLCILLGFLSLLSGIVATFSSQFISGILLIVQGIAALSMWFCMSEGTRHNAEPSEV